jgi:AraC-like DNA-binding protein
MTRALKTLKLDTEQIERLAALGCTDADIAQIAGVNERLLQRRHADALARGRANLRVSLRKAQIEKALSGDTAMLIWLGKVVLRQTERGGGDEAEQVTIRVVDETSDDDE